MATNQPVIIQPRPNVKQINYVAKTFTDFRQTLIDFARAYYPNTYSDFNETSPGMMFIEMASYVGDVLSFYIDNQFKENLLAYAEQQENVISISQFLGYKPKLTSPATTTATLYQLAPATIVNGSYVPDTKYLVKVARGSTFTTSTTTGQPATTFRLSEDINFSDITVNDYIVNTFNAGNPATFIVTKPAKLIAAEEKTTTFSFGAPQRFSSATIPDANVIGIETITDSDGNRWYEVDYLAQDVIMDDSSVTANNESGALPSARLRLRKVPRRFVTRINRDNRMELVFGSGTDNAAEVNTTLDSRQIANSQYGNTIESALGNVAINNVNFLNSNAYGVSPFNTTLTVRYLVGGGVTSNTPSNTINQVSSVSTLNDTTGYTPAEVTAFNAAVQSITINNDLPATGGGEGESIDEIRENALAFFNAQNRVVTVEDYAVRSYALPSKYGKIAKAYAVRDEQINRILAASNERVYVDNPVRPNAINLYTLGYDTNGNLATLNTVVKDNLARYLDQFRMLTDDINIVDAFIINIGVQFDISVLRNYNVNDVLARSIGTVQEFFQTDKWSINEPIILADLSYTIGLVEGVQTVRNVRIFNKYQFKDGAGYQNYRYDIDEATINGVIYPSLDPSIFELKYPQTDIIGNATQ
jgi:hypothetical protein